MPLISKSFQFGNQTVKIETGEIARQASGAVMVSMGDTIVMVTCVAKKEAVEGRDFFPLTVNYQEKAYSAGKIPGGFFKREGRPTEKETLTSRLIDRPLRPLFPKGFLNEVQVIATVMSIDADIDPDIVAMIGASAAVALSGAPFAGPIGAARVGYKNGDFMLNPLRSELKSSDLDLVVAGTNDAVLMVESEANILPESVMLDAVMYGHEQMQVVINTINEMVVEVNAPRIDWVAPAENTALAAAVKEKAESVISEAYQISDKMDRQSRLSTIKAEVLAELQSADDPEGWSAGEISKAIASLEKKIVRSAIIEQQPRIDGRDNDTVRAIAVRTSLLPRVHGSALFTRGETQAIVVATLGTERDAQMIDAIEGEYRDSFMLHYNFPPSCVGETGMVGSPKRREIGHGRLAKRGVMAIMPDMESYPYTVRIVSEITESNGSSSMASVCGSSLALMDAGVPIKAPVAGIAMGLIKEDNGFAVLTDILGDEDHLGDMDFKVAGTDGGITALQMDIKITGITKEIMQVALEKAKKGRLFILDEMNKVISEPRKELSEYAPRYTTLQINPDRIRDVIGKGGATIRAITEETGTSIDITDEGVVKIASIDRAAGLAAKKRVEELTSDVEVGMIYEGKVSKIMDFGAFVSILPGRDGLVHISQISEERVENVNDKLSQGDTVRVKVLEIDKQGRIRLSMKAVDAPEA